MSAVCIHARVSAWELCKGFGVACGKFATATSESLNVVQVMGFGANYVGAPIIYI
jgi:hypothetical protein